MLKAAYKKRERSGSNSGPPPGQVHRNGQDRERPPPQAAPAAASQQLSKWGLQWRVLLQRSWRQIKRDKGTTVARLMSNVSSALIFGSIYWRLGRRQDGVQNRMGLLQVRRSRVSSRYPLLASVIP